MRVWGNARALASVRHPRLGSVIAAAQEDHMLATAFHPELTTTAVHKYLLELALGKH